MTSVVSDPVSKSSVSSRSTELLFRRLKRSAHFLATPPPPAGEKLGELELSDCWYWINVSEVEGTPEISWPWLTSSSTINKGEKLKNLLFLNERKKRKKKVFYQESQKSCESFFLILRNLCKWILRHHVNLKQSWWQMTDDRIDLSKYKNGK